MGAGEMRQRDGASAQGAMAAPVQASAVDSLTALLIGAPGHASPRNALVTLRLLADDGDFQAALALCGVLADELGLAAGSERVREAATITELAHMDDVAPLVRIYGLGFLPGEMVLDLSMWTSLAAAAQGDDDLGSFKALIQRNAPIADEVLKAYILCAYVSMIGGFAGEYLSVGASLSILDQVLSNAKVVPGDNADATFEFGREFILQRRDVSSLLGTIGHELGHLISNTLLGGHEKTAASSTQPRELAAAIPKLVKAAIPLTERPLREGDDRKWLSKSGLSVLCSRVIGSGAPTSTYP